MLIMCRLLSLCVPDELCQPQRRAASVSLSGARSSGGSVLTPSLHATTTWESSAALAKKAGGFRLVDMERFLEELTTYAWLANGSRKKNTAVCLFHKQQRKSVQPPSASVAGRGAQYDSDEEEDERLGDENRASMQAQIDGIEREIETAGGEELVRHTRTARRATGTYFSWLAHLLSCFAFPHVPCEQKLFLGLSFNVPDIEQAINFLKNTSVGAAAAAAANASPVSPTASTSSHSAPSGRLEIQHIPGFPRFITFTDPAHTTLELTDGAMGLATAPLSTIETSSKLHMPTSFKKSDGASSIAASPFTPSPPSHAYTHSHAAPHRAAASLHPSPTRPLISSPRGHDFDATRAGVHDRDEWNDSSPALRPMANAHQPPSLSDDSVSSDDEELSVGLGAHVDSARGATGARFGAHVRKPSDRWSLGGRSSRTGISGFNLSSSRPSSSSRHN